MVPMCPLPRPEKIHDTAVLARSSALSPLRIQEDLKPEYWSTRAKYCIGACYQHKKTYLKPGTRALLSAAVLPRLTQEDPWA